MSHLLHVLKGRGIAAVFPVLEIKTNLRHGREWLLIGFDYQLYGCNGKSSA